MPLTGVNPAYLSQDITIIAARCFALAGSVLILGVAGLLWSVGGSHGVGEVAAGTALSAAAVLFCVGAGLLRYVKVTLRYLKMHQADEWIHAVSVHRIDRLLKREEELANSITELSARFERDKAALEEIREERLAQERMMAFVKGLQKSPDMQAYLANPRNRLHIVPDLDDDSSVASKAG